MLTGLQVGGEAPRQVLVVAADLVDLDGTSGQLKEGRNLKF